MRRIPRPSPAMVIALAGVTIGLGGVAFATIPDSSGTIHGCYSKSNGNLRVVETASDCRKNETALPWNQQGPPGGGSSVVSSEETGEVTTSSGSFVELGGPQVTVDVPASGLVNAYVRWEGRGVFRGTFGPNLDACISIFVDGQRVVIGGLFTCVGEGTFVSNPVTLHPIEASPGLHTVSLRYAGVCRPSSADCSGDSAAFRNRKLWVQPIG